MSEEPLIDPVRLHQLLGARAARFDVCALAEAASSSDLLLERAAAGAASGSVVVVDRQLAGRGRRGRSWQSSPAASLTFSLLWRFDGSAMRLSGLSLAIGVALARALEELGASGIGLKWPNDVLFASRKLAGILVELLSERQSTLAVIGIGINLQQPLADELALPAAGLNEALAVLPERHLLLASVLRALADCLDQFAASGFPGLRAAWQSRHAWQDAPVHLTGDGRNGLSGICRGVDDDGALLIATAAGIERCISGDLSLRYGLPVGSPTGVSGSAA